VRASGDAELLAAAVRAAGDVLSSGDTPGLTATSMRAGFDRPSDYGRISEPPITADRLVAALAGLCQDASPDVAIAALDSLRRAPCDFPGRLEAMARALEHPDVNVVKTAVLKLAAAFADNAREPGADLSPERHLPAGAWERLRSCLHHDLAELRQLTAESLCVIDPDRGREALVERARVERDPEVLAAIDAALSAAQRQKKGAAS
jgi:hypothetical protein